MADRWKGRVKPDPEGLKYNPYLNPVRKPESKPVSRSDVRKNIPQTLEELGMMHTSGGLMIMPPFSTSPPLSPGTSDGKKIYNREFGKNIESYIQGKLWHKNPDEENGKGILYLPSEVQNA